MLRKIKKILTDYDKESNDHFYNCLKWLFDNFNNLTERYKYLLNKEKEVSTKYIKLFKKNNRMAKQIEELKSKNDRLKHKYFTIKELKNLRKINRVADIKEDN